MTKQKQTRDKSFKHFQRRLDTFKAEENEVNESSQVYGLICAFHMISLFLAFVLVCSPPLNCKDVLTLAVKRSLCIKYQNRILMGLFLYGCCAKNGKKWERLIVFTVTVILK